MRGRLDLHDLYLKHAERPMSMIILPAIWMLILLISIVMSIVVMIRHWHEPRGQSSFVETVYILPFAVFPVGANVIHLIAIHTRPVSVSLELLFFTTLWGVIHKMNMAEPVWCKTRILGTFVLQIFVLLAMREMFPSI